MKRHEDISVRTPERVSKARVGVTEEVIRSWFTSLQNFIEENDLQNLMGDPSRIFNADETCVQLCPSSGKVIGVNRMEEHLRGCSWTGKVKFNFFGYLWSERELCGSNDHLPLQTSEGHY